MGLRRPLGGALQKSQGFGSKKTPPHGLVGLRAHAKPAMPQGTGITRRAGTHLYSVASAAHALPANGPQGLSRCLFRRGGAGLACQCATARPRGTLHPRRRRTALADAPWHSRQNCRMAVREPFLPLPEFFARSASVVSGLEALAFLVFLPLPQGRGSLHTWVPACPVGIRPQAHTIHIINLVVLALKKAALTQLAGDAHSLIVGVNSTASKSSPFSPAGTSFSVAAISKAQPGYILVCSAMSASTFSR